MLCPLSALSPSRGPEHLINNEDLQELSAEMAGEILSYGIVSLELQDVTSIVEGALRLTLPPPECPEIYERALKLPDGVSDWEHFDTIGIGYFNSEDYKPAQVEGRYRSGMEVQVRTLDQWSSYGYFHKIIGEDENGGEILEDMFICCTGDRGWNFFVMRGCLEYLRVWLDPNLPPRMAFKDSAPSMSLEGELYEILSSRHEERDSGGLFPSFEYGEISKTFEGYHCQYRFFMARRDSRHTAHAISIGLRGKKLLPALYADFRCWESMRPDLWPSPPTAESIRTDIFAQFSCWSNSFGANPFQSLPVEIFVEILSQLSIPPILTLSSTSRSLRQLITETGFLNQVIKTAMLSGTEFWILPVPNLPGEKERAWETASEWIRSASTSPLTSGSSLNPEIHTLDTTLLPELESPFLSPAFPYVPFLRACYASDSMRNRQRLWRIVKQFDVLWRDYRVNGWQRDDIFTH